MDKFLINKTGDLYKQFLHNDYELVVYYLGDYNADRLIGLKPEYMSAILYKESNKNIKATFDFKKREVYVSLKENTVNSDGLAVYIDCLKELLYEIELSKEHIRDFYGDDLI